MVALAWRDLDPLALLVIAVAVVIASWRGIRIYVRRDEDKE